MSWTKSKPSFYSDLKFGQEAEARFLEQFKGHLEAIDGRTGDFRIVGTEIKVEIKNDRYSHEKYPNFIMERFGSAGKDGGPFKALKDKCRFFIYAFPKDNVFYIFSTVQLVARIKKLVKKYRLKLHSIENTSWTTSYYKIERAHFSDLYKDESVLYNKEAKKGQKRVKSSKRPK